MSNIENQLDHIRIWTSDGLRLQGVHYEPRTSKNLCVLIVHGMSGNIIENYFADILGKTLAGNELGCIYGHNRGYNHTNDIATKKVKKEGGYETKRIGATYERFRDCIYDIDAWLKEVRKVGYKKIILLGHSLGCNKTLYYFHRKKPKDVVGIILASPPDMVGLVKKSEYQSNYKGLLKEARKNVKEGKQRKILSSMIWDWYHLSSQTFLDLFEENGPADNLSVLRNPKEFPELASINLPILAIMGEYDDIAIRTLQEDLDLTESKATGCSSFTKKFIPKASHNYDRQEQVFAESVLEWIKIQKLV